MNALKKIAKFYEVKSGHVQQQYFGILVYITKVRSSHPCAFKERNQATKALVINSNEL